VRIDSRPTPFLALSDGERLQRTLAAIAAANADDPNPIRGRGVVRPKEQAHAAMVSDWIAKLVPAPSAALQLAGRAHHLRRWAIPRADYPEGRAGYLRWRRALYDYHADEAAKILVAQGYDDATVRRVGDLLHKRGLARGDAEAQALEDALCLVFLETQFRELAERLEEGKRLDVTAKTLRKMSERAKTLAMDLPLDARDVETIRRAAELL
jgi:hypothetical protein